MTDPIHTAPNFKMEANEMQDPDQLRVRYIKTSVAFLAWLVGSIYLLLLVNGLLFFNGWDGLIGMTDPSVGPPWAAEHRTALFAAAGVLMLLLGAIGAKLGIDYRQAARAHRAAKAQDAPSPTSG